MVAPPAADARAGPNPPTDVALMRRALFHAARGQGRTTPNPMVGAVVVNAAGIVAAYGWHTRAGEPHAEVNALDEAGAAARGGTLYVTLEPCHHTGRTGPCTARIIDAGISRIVAAMRDPDERVSGRGFDALRAAGLTVDVGLCEREAERLNAAFVSVKTRRRPFVILKAATTLDGQIAAAGRRTHLSSPESDRKTQQIRAAVDGILVGSDTVLIDDPWLTARTAKRIRPLTRVILDRRLRVPPGARLFSTLDEGPVIVLTSPSALVSASKQVEALTRAGAIVRAVDGLASALTSLLQWDVSTLLVEGGARVHAALWAERLVDRVHLIVTPKTLHEEGTPLFAGFRVARSELSFTTVEPRGDDIWIEADVHRNH